MSEWISGLLKMVLSGSAGEAESALTDVGFLFEKARLSHRDLSVHDQQTQGWTENVVAHDPADREIQLLRSALVDFVQTHLSFPHAEVEPVSTALWALGKRYDKSLIPFFQQTLRRLLSGDPSALYQAMIALDNLDEPVFGDLNSMSVDDVEVNRKRAASYLDQFSKKDANEEAF